MALSLRGMRMSTLPDELAQRPELSRLLSLNLSRNQLFNSFHVFGIVTALDNLKSLDLSSNFLHGPLSDDAVNLTNLESLKLDDNQISALPERLGAWPQMREFSVANNQLVKLPDSCGEWPLVESVNLRKNKLVLLPPTVGNWTGLRRLWLSGNMLSTVPPEMGHMTSLEELDISHNQLGEIPTEFKNMTQLTALHLGHNALKEFPAEIFETVTGESYLRRLLFSAHCARFRPISTLASCVRYRTDATERRRGHPPSVPAPASPRANALKHRSVGAQLEMSHRSRLTTTCLLPPPQA